MTNSLSAIYDACMRRGISWRLEFLGNFNLDANFRSENIRKAILHYVAEKGLSAVAQKFCSREVSACDTSQLCIIHRGGVMLKTCIKLVQICFLVALDSVGKIVLELCSRNGPA